MNIQNSKEKPGPGWIQVTPEIIDIFRTESVKLAKIHEDIKRIKHEILEQESLPK